MSWQKKMREAVAEYIGAEYVDKASLGHLRGVHSERTPERVVKAFKAMVSGYVEFPGDCLAEALFKCEVDAMVHVSDIDIHTTCAHHLLPIIGKAHFAYIPRGQVVGLSKIPRFIDILCRRLQVQEELCNEIVDVFQNTVQPEGCAVWIKAIHCCMSVRGVEEHDAQTTVMSVRGALKSSRAARMELLAAIDQRVRIIG